jgi:hypothetical protein
MRSDVGFSGRDQGLSGRGADMRNRSILTHCGHARFKISAVQLTSEFHFADRKIMI